MERAGAEDSQHVTDLVWTSHVHSGIFVSTGFLAEPWLKLDISLHDRLLELVLLGGRLQRGHLEDVLVLPVPGVVPVQEDQAEAEGREDDRGHQLAQAVLHLGTDFCNTSELDFCNTSS